MKLDLFNKQWIDIVFEGRNKAYGAYELRQENSKTSVRALLIGAVVFILAVSAPLIYNLIPDMSTDDANLDQKIVTIKLPPKDIPKDIPPPPPPPPKQDQVKFVKPVVAKTDEIVEEPPKVEEIKDKKLGDETIKGDENAPLTVEPVGNGPSVVEDDNQIYNTAGIEVKPDFPGGLDKFYRFVGKNYTAPEDCGSGKVFLTFVVEKDGSLTDIKVLREVCPGSGKEAIRVLKSCPRWNPGEQNGKKVRVLYSLPITIQSQE
jgi:protein TonB